MTDSGSTKGSWLRPPRLAHVLIVLSLALNLFFAIGFMQSRMHERGWRGGNMEDRFDQLAERIGVSPKTPGPFLDLRHTVTAALNTQRERNKPLSAELFKELGASQPDEDKIRNLADQISTNRRATQKQVLEALLTFVRAASPDQRDKLIEVMRDRRAPAAWPIKGGLGH